MHTHECRKELIPAPSTHRDTRSQQLILHTHTHAAVMWECQRFWKTEQMSNVQLPPSVSVCMLTWERLFALLSRRSSIFLSSPKGCLRFNTCVFGGNQGSYDITEVAHRISNAAVSVSQSPLKNVCVFNSVFIFLMGSSFFTADGSICEAKQRTWSTCCFILLRLDIMSQNWTWIELKV